MAARAKSLASALAPSFILRWFAECQGRYERNRQALSAYASHDVRSPMATVREAAALLADGVPGMINDQQRRLLAIILERTETWLRLVDEVVVLPQWVAEGSPIHLRGESLRDVARESIEKTKGLALLREITVHVMMADTLPKIMVDRLRLGQALNILLAAVISSTEQGSQVRLSLMRVSETELKVEVSSTRATKSVKGGTAMIVVRSVVEGHGGRLSANITGTVNNACSFTLPLRIDPTSN